MDGQPWLRLRRTASDIDDAELVEEVDDFGVLDDVDIVSSEVCNERSVRFLVGTFRYVGLCKFVRVHLCRFNFSNECFVG
jgi:hypothetical protein